MCHSIEWRAFYRKRSADINVRAHTRWMRSSPSPSPSPSLSPSPGRRCHFYRGPLGQPDTVRIRTVFDARHASDTALPRAADTRRTLSDTDEYCHAVSDACRASDTVRARTVSGCPVQRVPWCAFCRKRRTYIYIYIFFSITLLFIKNRRVMEMIH